MIEQKVNTPVSNSTIDPHKNNPFKPDVDNDPTRKGPGSEPERKDPTRIDPGVPEREEGKQEKEAETDPAIPEKAASRGL